MMGRVCKEQEFPETQLFIKLQKWEDDENGEDEDNALNISNAKGIFTIRMKRREE